MTGLLGELLSSCVPLSIPPCLHLQALLLYGDKEKGKGWGGGLPDPQGDRRLCRPLCSCPGNLRERDSKVYGAHGYRQHPIWSRGGRGHPDSAKKVWAAFTGGKGNERNLWAGLFGPIQCPLVVSSPSYRTVGIDVLYGCISSSCKCHRGVSPTGRAARRKVLVPSGPTALLTMLGYKSLRFVISLTGTSDKGRCPGSSGLCLPATGSGTPLL